MHQLVRPELKRVNFPLNGSAQQFETSFLVVMHFPQRNIKAQMKERKEYKKKLKNYAQ